MEVTPVVNCCVDGYECIVIFERLTHHDENVAFALIKNENVVFALIKTEYKIRL